MEFLKAFGQGWLKGAGLTAVSLVVTHKYNSIVDEKTPTWLRLLVNTSVMAGTFWCGLKVTEAAEKYLEEEV